MVSILKRSLRFLLKIIISISLILIGGGLVISLFFPIGYTDYIYKYSLENGLDPYCVAAIINVESKYNKDAVSIKDARGLMQITNQTGKWGADELGMEGFTNDMLFDPEVNIRIGTWYLNQLKKEFNDNKDLVLAAYNAGSGNVSKWLKDERYSQDGESLYKIPFEETDKYLDKVNFSYQAYKSLYSDYMEKPETIQSLYFDVIINFRIFIKDFSNL